MKTVKSAKVLKSAKILEARSDEYANGRVALLKQEIDSRIKRILKSSLRYGWLEGYTAAMNDVVAIREVENEVKH